MWVSVNVLRRVSTTGYVSSNDITLKCGTPKAPPQPITVNGVTLGACFTLNNNSGLPSNVRIWHQGGGSITLNGGTNMKAVVFAPNTPLVLNGNSSIYGAVWLRVSLSMEAAHSSMTKL